MRKQTVLITGCSSGFGRLASKTFHSKGWNVIATMRSPEKEVELNDLDHALVTRLDVTDNASITSAVKEGFSRFGGLDAVVNNAGYGGHGLFEQVSDASIRHMYDTNVFGVMNVMRETLPFLRTNGGGTVVNVTSMAGMIGLPGNAIYSSSKYAVEGLTEAMAIEYRPFGIKVKSVLPGAYPTTRFDTNVTDDLTVGDDQLKAHSLALRNQIEAVGAQMSAAGGSVSDPQEVANKIYECTVTDTPVHNPVGADSQMLVSMMNGPADRDVFINQMAAMLLPKN